MSSQTSTKKRKRAESSPSDQVKVSVYDKSPSAVGPVLACFPALEPPQSTAFGVYAPPSARVADKLTVNVNNSEANNNAEQEGKEEDFARRSLFVAGETDAVELYSTGESEAVRGGCRYLIGIHNKRTNTLLLRPSPLQILGRRVKALKSLPSSSVLPSSSDISARMEQRNALGEAFGTKKAVKAIRAAERNKVDISAMEGVTGHIQESVESGTKGLPTQEEAKELADASRQIPKYNLDARRPEDVYKLHDIVPESELSAIQVKDIMAASLLEERLSFFPAPLARSEWIRQHVKSIFESEKPSKRTLRIVLYVAILLTFRSAAVRYCKKRTDFEERLPGVPSIVIDGIYARFTEDVRGSSETKFTSENAVRLLTHVFALCLHVDQFATDTTLIAADLKESVTKVNQHFKLLGCKIEKLSMAEASRLGIGGAATGEQQKRAVLRVPLEFPKARMKRRK